ncbi:MAG: hypothetical protein GZ094_22250, partial [Mariniphaga sp.]|nr:hypothetical protein [Mariniphaga sp.]
KIQSKKDNIIEFKVKCSRNIKEAVVWYSSGEMGWMKNIWNPILAKETKSGLFKAILPTGHENSLWYIIVTNENSLSNGSKIYSKSDFK